jgi:hypothetical protein
MKKLLLILLLCASCNNDNNTSTNISQFKKHVDTLKVDVSHLSYAEKIFVHRIDSISSNIDSNSLLVRSFEISSKQTNMETELRYKGYSEKKDETVNKIVATRKDDNRLAAAKYYYFQNKVVKIVGEIGGKSPNYMIIYYMNDKSLFANGVPPEAANLLKAQSEVLLNYFK